MKLIRKPIEAELFEHGMEDGYVDGKPYKFFPKYNTNVELVFGEFYIFEDENGWLDYKDKDFILRNYIIGE
jgi:hypothetical protein